MGKIRFQQNGEAEVKSKLIVTRHLLWIFALASAALCARPAAAQDWFKTGTGLGVEKARVAVPEFAARDAASQPLEKVFHDTLVSDLAYSGILELISPSFYPTGIPGSPAELKAADWSGSPASAYMVAYGNLAAAGGALAVSAWLSDVRNAGTPPALSKIYRGQPTESDARAIAHQFADAIVALLSGGGTGIAGTRIAYISNRSGHKEVWVMDYDGQNQHQLSHLGTTSLTPRWSPDASKIAFTCYVPYHGFTSVQICMLSLDTGGMLAFARYPGTNSSPGWSPDGSKLAFMSGAYGADNIVVTGPSGGDIHRLTFGKSVDTSPVWNPKTGAQIVFVSDRGGLPALYQMNADGSDVSKIDTADKGYVIDPSWSPNGQLLAFSWRVPTVITTSTRWTSPAALSSSSPATPAATSAPVGRPTAATSSSNPPAPAAARSGRCSPMAASLASSPAAPVNTNLPAGPPAERGRLFSPRSRC